MSKSTIVILLILAGIAAVVRLGLGSRRPPVHMIDAIDLMRLRDARRTRQQGRRRRARWAIMGIMAIVLASLLWSVFRGG